jgi:hypothetical protein
VTKEVAVDTLVSGFTEALRRFREVRVAKDQRGTFVALAECLMWTATLSERLDLARGDGQTRDLLHAFKWIRNRVHHQWADAVYLDESAAEFPMRFPLSFFEWRWRASEQVPDADRRHPDHHGREDYDELMAGEPVRRTLRALIAAFNKCAGLSINPDPVSD